jgi:transcriptional regulator with XRE-family HTH domain
MAEELALGFGGLLRQLRAVAGLTQEELAEAASLSPRSVSDLERGVNRTARRETAELLAGALGLDGPARPLFVAAARGRAPAEEVLAALREAAAPEGPAPGPAPPESPYPGLMPFEERDARPYYRGDELADRLRAAGGVQGFPAVLTSFVGRDVAGREAAGLLGEYRLVTVTGPGGVGKTRLAGEVAQQVAARFADGAWLAELAAVRDPARVAAAVAVALGVREEPGVSAAVAVVRVLARRQLLLVLDNCEHVIGAVGDLWAGLLQACDDVRVLATSREPLRIAGEAAYRLAPLPVPGPGDADVEGAEAVALFADRARAADVRFALTGENRSEVARLVGRLDGMPLAIELAAARVEALGVSQLLDWMDDRLALPEGGDRRAAGRHRSLAAAAEWSYQLLTEDERRVFRQLSVFPAPFTLEAPGRLRAKGRRRRCCGWWSARCWSRRGPARMADCGTRCWRRCGATAPGWSRRRTSRTTPKSRWPGTRCGWPSRPRRG